MFLVGFAILYTARLRHDMSNTITPNSLSHISWCAESVFKTKTTSSFIADFSAEIRAIYIFTVLHRHILSGMFILGGAGEFEDFSPYIDLSLIVPVCGGFPLFAPP